MSNRWVLLNNSVQRCAYYTEIVWDCYFTIGLVALFVVVKTLIGDEILLMLPLQRTFVDIKQNSASISQSYTLLRLQANTIVSRIMFIGDLTTPFFSFKCWNRCSVHCVYPHIVVGFCFFVVATKPGLYVAEDNLSELLQRDLLLLFLLYEFPLIDESR